MSRLLSFALAVLLVASAAFAQTARDGRLIVTVVDQTGAVIAGATVMIVGQDEANRVPAVPSVQTSDQGIAAVPGLRLGRYTVQAEFPGFQVGLAKEVRVRVGDNKQTVALAIERLQDEVTVSQGAQESAADPRSRTFGSTLAREQVEALSFDDTRSGSRSSRAARSRSLSSSPAPSP